MKVSHALAHSCGINEDPTIMKLNKAIRCTSKLDRRKINKCSFVEVKGTSKMEPELLIIPSEEEEVEATRKKAVPLRAGDGLGAVADALSSSSLGPDSCVRLLWPRHRCPLLSDDVVLVDTPGQFILCYPWDCSL